MRIGSRVTTSAYWRNRFKAEAPATGVIVKWEGLRWLVRVDDPEIAARYTDGILAFFPHELFLMEHE